MAIMQEWILELRHTGSVHNDHEPIPVLTLDADILRPRATLSDGTYVSCRTMEDIADISHDRLEGIRIVRFLDDAKRPEDDADLDLREYMETDPYESRDIVLHNAVEMLKPRLVSTLTRIPGLWLEQDFETINVIEARARIARLRLALQSAKGDGGVLAILHDLDAILDSMTASREIGRSRHERALEIMGALVSAATLGQLTWQICHDLKAPFWVGWASLAILTVIAMMSTAINGGRRSTPRQETGNQ